MEGVPYHITQRGNAKQRVFFDEDDYCLYLKLLERFAGENGLRISAYCLMPNHVHLVAVPEVASSMASTLGRLHADYARFSNLKRQLCGHVWQARYYSCPLDGAHLWRAVAYVERNPVRAFLVKSAGDFAWSSAAARLGYEPKPGWLDLEAWSHDYTAQQWEWALATSVDEEAWGRRLRDASMRGRPLGSDEFIEKLESAGGRTLRPKPVGRPRKRLTDVIEVAAGKGI